MNRASSASSAEEVLGEPRIVIGGMFGVEPAETSDWRLAAFVDHGGRFVETAYSYAGGRSIAALGGWLSAHPGQLSPVVKIGHDATGADMELTRHNIWHDVTDSLQILAVDHAGVAMLHNDDESRPVEAIADVLVDIVEQGLADCAGISNWAAPRLATAIEYLQARGHTPVASYHYSLASVDPTLLPGSSMAANDDILAVLDQFDVPLLSWSANARGFFAQPALESTQPAPDDYFDTALSRARRARVVELAHRLALPPATVALAWTLSRPKTYVSVSPSHPAHLQAAYAAASTTLSAADALWLLDGSGSDSSVPTQGRTHA